MEDNNEDLEKQYKAARFVAKIKKIKSIFISIAITIIIIKIIFNAGVGMLKDYEEYKNDNETARMIEEMNFKINYVTDFDAEDFDIEELKEIEFDNGIKIPTMGVYEQTASILNFSKNVEDNIVANDSPVININYEQSTISGFFIDMFTNEFLKKENYRIVYHNGKEIKVYIREELNDYFSYIIVNGYKLTYGASFGEPKIKY